MTTVLITGNTYPVKDQIKALGGRWDSVAKGWNVPADMGQRAVYFYYTRTDGAAWGILHAIADGDNAPIGAELVCAERMPAGTVQQINAWIRRFTGQLPLIPAGV